MRPHSWYYGRITRADAEKLLMNKVFIQIFGIFSKNKTFYNFEKTFLNFEQFFLSSYIVRRPQNLAKSSPNFDCMYCGQKLGEDFSKFCGLLRIYELYDQSIFCLPHGPNFSDIFDLCLHWVSVVREFIYSEKATKFCEIFT